METLITVVHVFAAIVLIGFVLLQSGRGGGLGGGLGGAGQQVFGGRGAAPLLVKVTTTAAALFMITSFSLSVLSSRNAQRSVIDTANGIGASETPGDAPTETNSEGSEATDSESSADQSSEANPSTSTSSATSTEAVENKPADPATETNE